MKILFSVCFAILFASSVKAGDFTGAISTYPITEVATMSAQISGAKKIDKLVISNSTTTVQTVTVYTLCASTTTVTPILTVTMPANTLPLVLDFSQNYNNPLAPTSVCFRKSDEAAPVYVSVHYR